jgi:S-formylglutathione hydrolase FrmB
MMKCYFFLLGLALVLCNLVDYVFGDAPNFVSAHGITVRSSSQVNNQLYDVFLSSNEVRGFQRVRILVPRDYTTSGNNRRYPVLYLLHGAHGGATDWSGACTAQTTCGNTSLITVMPNGDPFGFYTNWVNPGDVAPQNWRTYHMEQLVPWIDFNFRTVAKKEGRAIGGLSMGGFGAIRYAQQYPNNFAYAAGFSGLYDLLDIRIQQTIIGLPNNGNPLLGPFGSPSEPLGSSGWFAQNPVTHAASLRGVTLALYIGTGDDLERVLRDTNYRLRDALNSLNIPLYFNDYGNGQSIGYGCNGGHTWPCWVASLNDVLPRMMTILQQQY